MRSFKRTLYVVGEDEGSCLTAIANLEEHKPSYHLKGEIPSLEKSALEGLMDHLDDYYDGVDIITEEYLNSELSLFEETKLLLVERNPIGSGYGVYSVCREPVIRQAMPVYRLIFNRTPSGAMVNVRHLADGTRHSLCDYGEVKNLDFNAMEEEANRTVKNLTYMLDKNPIDGSAWGREIRRSPLHPQYLAALLEQGGVEYIEPSQFMAVCQYPNDAAKLLPYAPYRLAIAPKGDLLEPKDASVEAWLDYATLCKLLIKNSAYVMARDAFFNQ